MTPKHASELAFWTQLSADHGGDLRKTHGLYEHFYTEFFEMGSYEGKKVLDIGCGPAGTLEWADEAAERVGLDPLADEYRAHLNVSAHKMQYMAGYSEAIPYPAGYFDVVCSFNSLDHVDYLDATVAEIKRVTAPGGFFLLLTEIHLWPTLNEPLVLPWEVVDQFAQEFRLLGSGHFEKHPMGLYQSLWSDIGSVTPFDHADPRPRYGVLTAKFVRV